MVLEIRGDLINGFATGHFHAEQTNAIGVFRAVFKAPENRAAAPESGRSIDEPCRTKTATPTATPTETETATPAPFETFIQTVEHLDKNEYLGGIYVEGLLALKLKAGGGDGITKQNNEATIVAGADTVIIFAHDNIEGSKFWLLSGKTVYYIKSDGTWGEYKVNNQTNFYDIDGKKQVFSKKPYPYEQPYLTTDNLEAQYYPKGKPEGEMNPTTIVFQTCLSDIAPEGYKTPGEITDTGVQFTTAGASDDTTLPAP